MSPFAAPPCPRGPRPPLSPDDGRALVVAAHARAAILVEGWSDQAALEALARRRGRDLLAEGIVVVPIGGATNLLRFVQALGPQGLGVRLAGLCDIAELRHVRRGLEGAGMTADERIEDHGFYACDADLEDELIRALGLAESGGMVRVGLVHYNTQAEIDRLTEALRELVARA